MGGKYSTLVRVIFRSEGDTRGHALLPHLLTLLPNAGGRRSGWPAKLVVNTTLGLGFLGDDLLLK